MPSSTESLRLIRRLAEAWPGERDQGARTQAATDAVLGLCAAHLAERENRLPACRSPQDSLRELERATGYRFLRDVGPGGDLLADAWALVTRISAERSPHAVLTAVYEDSLRSRAGGDDQNCQLDGYRKRYGVFYTPADVVRWVVHHALTPLGETPMPAVLDPAMGTGVFLVEAARLLPGPPARAAERCLFGIDRDPTAVRLAVLSLWLETGARPTVLQRHLRRADALYEPLIPRSFDAVVGNPPWGARYEAAERETLMKLYPATSRLSFDSFKLFLDVGSALSRGTLGMVVPQAVLGQTRHADVRQVLLDRMAPHAARRLQDGAFPGAAAPACALVFGSRQGPGAVSAPAARVPEISEWTADRFSLGNRTLLSLLGRLRSEHPSLGDLGHLYRVRDVGMNYNRAAVASRIFYEGRRQDSRDLARYRGRNFSRYTGITAGGWLRHDAAARLQPGEVLSLAWSTFAMPEKVVFRQTADRPIATLDRTGMAFGRSVIAVTAEAPVSLRALLACLNSQLMAALYRALSGEEGRLLPQVKVGMVAQLPVPVASGGSVDPDLGAEMRRLPVGEEERLLETARDAAGAWTLLDCLAERLLSLEGADSRLDRLIDRVVERLYGLTDGERDLIATAY